MWLYARLQRPIVINLFSLLIRKKNLFRFTLSFESLRVKSTFYFNFGYLVFILSAISIFNSNCSLNPNNEKSIASDATVSASEILSVSITQMKDLNSFYFKSSGSISASETLLLTQIQGAIIKPDYMNLEINGSYTSGLVFKTRLISNNGESFILNPLNKKWEAVSENFNPTGFFAPHQGIAKIMTGLYDIRLSTENSSRNYYHLHGNIDSSSLNDLLGEIPTQSQIKVSLSIGKNNKLLYHAKLNGKFIGSKPATDLFIDISKHNQPVKIETPIIE